MKMYKSADEIHNELWNLSHAELTNIWRILKETRSIASELTMIERGRKIHDNLTKAIDELEGEIEYLGNYPITKEVSDKCIPIA